VSGLRNAGHMENDPNPDIPLLILATCPVESGPENAPRLWGKLRLQIESDTLASRIYQSSTAEEAFTCNYELNPAYQGILEETGMRVSGISEDGAVRIIELPGHKFFLATGFVPQLISEEKKPHPLVVAYLGAAA
jgi:CTP synthase (UTP-ammonia lyase)